MISNGLDSTYKIEKHTYIEPISLEEFKSSLNITILLNSSEIINGSNFIAVILSSNDLNPKEQLKKGISTIDLGNCSKIIKNHYNISENENLIILNIESRKINNNQIQKKNNNE